MNFVSKLIIYLRGIYSIDSHTVGCKCFLHVTTQEQDSITAAHAPYPSVSKEKFKLRVPGNH